MVNKDVLLRKHAHLIIQRKQIASISIGTHTCNIRLTGPSFAVYGNSPVPHSKSARPRLQISAG